jgi:hypothetical protein
VVHRGVQHVAVQFAGVSQNVVVLLLLSLLVHTAAV